MIAGDGGTVRPILSGQRLQNSLAEHGRLQRSVADTQGCVKFRRDSCWGDFHPRVGNSKLSSPPKLESMRRGALSPETVVRGGSSGCGVNREQECPPLPSSFSQQPKAGSPGPLKWSNQNKGKHAGILAWVTLPLATPGAGLMHHGNILMPVCAGGSLGSRPKPTYTEALNPGSPWAESAETGFEDWRGGRGLQLPGVFPGPRPSFPGTEAQRGHPRTV